MNTQDKIEALFKPLPRQYSVAYALSCAESVVDLAEDNDKAKAEACIDLVKRWLSGEPGLESQLNNAAYAAWAVHSTAYASYAASAAYSAAYSAAKAGKSRGKAYDKCMEEYYSKAKAFVEAIPEVERLLWA